MKIIAGIVSVIVYIILAIIFNIFIYIIFKDANMWIRYSISFLIGIPLWFLCSFIYRSIMRLSK